MTKSPNVDALVVFTYGVKNGGLSPVDRPQSNRLNFGQRERGMNRPKGLYMEAKTVNQWRIVRGLGVAEMAELTGTGENLLSYLYRGVEPRVEQGLKIADVLGVRVEQIIWGRMEKVDRASLPSMPKSQPFNPREGTPAVSDEQMEVAVAWAAAGCSKVEIAESMGVSRPTFYGALEKYEARHGPVMFTQGRPKLIKNSQMQGQATQKAKKGRAEKGDKEKPSSRSRKAVKDVL